MADLTRFDFHAKKFWFSEDVQIMSAEEIGQYLILMIVAWLGGKDATLPESPDALARMCGHGVQSISDAVLAKFPVVETEHGNRRRNETLFSEWTAAIKRVEDGRASVARRPDRQPLPNSNETSNTPQGTYKVPTSQLLPRLNPNQARPGSGQTNQSSPVQPSVERLDSPSVAVAPDPAEKQKPDFKTFKLLWERETGDKLGHNKNTVYKYEEACNSYGVSEVHDAVTLFATPSMVEWLKDHDIKFWLGYFLKKLPEFVDKLRSDVTRDVAMNEAQEKVEAAPSVITPEKKNEVDQLITRQVLEELAERDARAERFSKPVDIEKESVLDYL